MKKALFKTLTAAVLTAALIIPSTAALADPEDGNASVTEAPEASSSDEEKAAEAQDALNAALALNALNALMLQNAEAEAAAAENEAKPAKPEKPAVSRPSMETEKTEASENAEETAPEEEEESPEEEEPAPEEEPESEAVLATKNAINDYIEREKASITAAREDIERAKEINLEKEKAEIIESMPDDTYIDVDLTNQVLTYYKNGMPAITSEVVTGNTSRHNDTPEGVYEIYMKQKGRTLRGPDYETFVNYWMPFTGNYGLHDATWRGAFGGSIYRTAGSHGCVNLPKSAASTLYELAPIGTKVYVHS